MTRVPLSFVSAADLLDPEPIPPVVIERPKRRSTLKAKPLRRREPRPLVASLEDIAAMVAATDL